MNTKTATRLAKRKVKRLPDFAMERADLLAELFLQDLHPQMLLRHRGNGSAGFDFLVAVPRGNALEHFAVDVKATDRTNMRNWRFASKHPQLEMWKKSNLPLLYLIVNPKTNELCYGWAKDAKRAPGGLSLPLRPGEKLALDFAGRK